MIRKFFQKLYADCLSHLFKLDLIENAYKQEKERYEAFYLNKIEEHKKICINYVNSSHELNEGRRECDMAFRYAANRDAWITRIALSYVVPDEKEQKELWLRAWNDYIRRSPDQRCSWCVNDPEDKRCGRCLRGEPKPEPISISLEEVDKRIAEGKALLATYQKEIEND